MGSQGLGNSAAVSLAPLSDRELAQMSDEELRTANDVEAALVATHQGRLTAIVGELDRRQAFRADGATSTQAWLVERNGISAASARSLVRVAVRLFDLPSLAGALSRGGVSFDKVRVAADVAAPETDAEWAQKAEELSVAELAEVARSNVRPGAADTRAEHQARSLRCNDTLRTVTAQLPPADYAEVRAALEARAEVLDSDAGTPWDQRLADAFVSLIRSGSSRRAGAGSAYTVVAHAPIDILLDDDSELCGELERGGLISAEVVRRLACDATLIIGVDDDVGHTMYEGRQVRQATATQRREIMRRDRHCRFPGCGHRLFWIPHHIKQWKRDLGTTDLDNLVALCAYHHHLIHSEGWNMSGDANAELTFVGPSGRVVTSRPSPLWTRVTEPGTKRATG
jgi:Domain of unknown function (DUF222)